MQRYHRQLISRRCSVPGSCTARPVQEKSPRHASLSPPRAKTSVAARNPSTYSTVRTSQQRGLVASTRAAHNPSRSRGVRRPTRPKIRRALGAGPRFLSDPAPALHLHSSTGLSPEGVAVHVHLCRASPNALTKRRPEHTWTPASGFQLTNHLRPPSLRRLRQLPTRRNSLFLPSYGQTWCYCYFVRVKSVSTA
jgi:hypothetical protein